MRCYCVISEDRAALRRAGGSGEQIRSTAWRFWSSVGVPVVAVDGDDDGLGLEPGVGLEDAGVDGAFVLAPAEVVGQHVGDQSPRHRSWGGAKSNDLRRPIPGLPETAALTHPVKSRDATAEGCAGTRRSLERWPPAGVPDGDQRAVGAGAPPALERGRRASGGGRWSVGHRHRRGRRAVRPFLRAPLRSSGATPLTSLCRIPTMNRSHDQPRVADFASQTAGVPPSSDHGPSSSLPPARRARLDARSNSPPGAEGSAIVAGYERPALLFVRSEKALTIEVDEMVRGVSDPDLRFPSDLG